MSLASRTELTQGQASNLRDVLVAASLALGEIPSVPEKGKSVKKRLDRRDVGLEWLTGSPGSWTEWCPVTLSRDTTTQLVKVLPKYEVGQARENAVLRTEPIS